MDLDALTAAQRDALLRQPFDHHARYRLAADVVLATVGPSATVLDLGGGPGSLHAFLPRAKVVSTDIVAPGEWHQQAPRLVLADGARLPFRDGAFDAVVSLDTLEHVRPESRDDFLAETARVAARWALVVCPFDTPGVADADTALRAYVANRFPPDLPTIGILDEHLGYGHPSLERTRALLAAHGDVAVVPSGRLDRWLGWMIAFFHLLALRDDEVVEVTQRVLNRLLYDHDLVEPAYRHGVLLRHRDGADPGPAQVVGDLVAGGRDMARPDGAEMLSIVLRERLAELVDASTAERERLSQELAEMTARWEITNEAERQTRVHAQGLEEARAADRRRIEALEHEVDGLRAWREEILSHPAVRARAAFRRLVQRRRL